MNQIIGHITVPEGAIIDRPLDDSGAFEQVRAYGGKYPVTIDADGTYYFAEVFGTRIAAAEVTFIDGRQQIVEDHEAIENYRTGLGCWSDFFQISDDLYRGFQFEATEGGL
jgi:hypothetical protein